MHNIARSCNGIGAKELKLDCRNSEIVLFSIYTYVCIYIYVPNVQNVQPSLSR